MEEKKETYDSGSMVGAMVVGALFALVFCLAIAYFTDDSNEALIRQNERLTYENAKLKDANIRLLDELSEGIENWEDIK